MKKVIIFILTIIICQSCNYIIPESRKCNDAVVLGKYYTTGVVGGYRDYWDSDKYCLEITYKKGKEFYGRNYYDTSNEDIKSFNQYEKVSLYRTWNHKYFILNKEGKRLYFKKKEFRYVNNYEKLFEDNTTVN